MIEIENYEVMNIPNAIRGMRNPMNSWDKMDSFYNENGEFIIGSNDMELMKKLTGAGTDHRKFLRQIIVSVDITAPLYWWKEFDTYKVGTVANSCSTMHKIHEKEFTVEDFSCEHLLGGGLYDSTIVLKNIIVLLNFWRNRFNETEADRTIFFNYNGYPYVPTKKECWWQMIQLLPSSYNQLRTVTLNYEVLLNQYFSRITHKLDEWKNYCNWIEQLPYMKELIEACMVDKYD